MGLLVGERASPNFCSPNLTFPPTMVLQSGKISTPTNNIQILETTNMPYKVPMGDELFFGLVGNLYLPASRYSTIM